MFAAMDLAAIDHVTDVEPVAQDLRQIADPEPYPTTNPAITDLLALGPILPSRSRSAARAPTDPSSR